MTDGSFLCFRKLKQNVSDWNKFLVDASNQLGTWSDQLGARLIGRWKSGMSLQDTLREHNALTLRLRMSGGIVSRV